MYKKLSKEDVAKIRSDTLLRNVRVARTNNSFRGRQGLFGGEIVVVESVIQDGYHTKIKLRGYRLFFGITDWEIVSEVVPRPKVPETIIKRGEIHEDTNGINFTNAV